MFPVKNVNTVESILQGRSIKEDREKLSRHLSYRKKIKERSQSTCGRICGDLKQEALTII